MSSTNVSIKCPTPRIVEKQKELRCGKHAINNLFQTRNFATCKQLRDISTDIAKTYNIKLNELISKSGYYDISVLIAFLIQNNKTVQYLSHFNDRNVKRLVGFIIGNGTHWISIRKQPSNKKNSYCFFVLDSLHNKPIEINNIRNWISKYFRNINQSDRAIIKVMD